MRFLRPWMLVAAVAAMFVCGAVWLFNLQFSAGTVYPEFSSMRTDPMGTRLLFDSLERLPGITVERNYLPFELLPRDGATVMVLGLDPLAVNWNGSLILKRAEVAASRGNRVVVAAHWNREDPPQPDAFTSVEKDSGKAEKKKQELPEPPPLVKMWGVRFDVDKTPDARHPLYFAEAQGWTVLFAEGNKLLAVERAFGKGTVVLMAESGGFTNISMVGAPDLPGIGRVIGPYRRIVFDEQHLGVAETGSVAGMIRQFRLVGLALGLGFWAGLFIWRNASGFPPPVTVRAGERFSGRTTQAGLLTLLKRHIPPAELAAACWRQWLAVNRHEATPERIREAEAIVTAAAKSPVAATQEIQTVLHAKGTL